ncbi:ArsR/SmtB family transcription factor [Lysinimonas soli]|uniref:ArsR/SmtB family transcription factor n=1 Tax=Lysinimonas soli TaxID=1074233 RepID=A0ABW0NP32_9MICO
MATDEAFKALADASRRELLDRLNARNGQTLAELCEGLDMSRQAVSKHLAVLETAGLVTTLRRGREKLHYLDAAPINAIADRWISRYDRPRAQALADLKTALEHPMTEPTFVYTSYITAPPEKVWQAITDPAFTRRYWNLTFDTDWTPGSHMIWDNDGVIIDDPEQKVLEYEPYTRLSYTWHQFTPELVEAIGMDADKGGRMRTEPRSHATFTLEPTADGTKLTVLHEGFPEGSEVIHSISGGWPIVISRLKTMLETGDVTAVSFRARARV